MKLYFPSSDLPKRLPVAQLKTRNQKLRTGKRGFTLVEMITTMAVSSILLIAATSASFYILRTANQLNTYNELQLESAQVLNQLRQDIRWADAITTPTANSLMLEYDDDPLTLGMESNIIYVYNPGPPSNLTRQENIGGAAGPTFNLFNPDIAMLPPTAPPSTDIFTLIQTAAAGNDFNLVRIRMQLTHTGYVHQQITLNPDVTYTQRRQRY